MASSDQSFYSILFTLNFFNIKYLLLRVVPTIMLTKNFKGLSDRKVYVF